MTPSAETLSLLVLFLFEPQPEIDLLMANLDRGTLAAMASLAELASMYVQFHRFYSNS
jgi:hypothetical protein